LVDDGADVALINDKLQAIPPKYAPPTTKRIFNQSFEEFTAGNPWKLDLQALPDIYLSSDPPFNSFGPIGNKQFVQVFMAIGLVVLTLSCINFMNLSTAKSSSRAKEVGVRKVLGSLRNSLIRQFVFESVLFVSVSTILALVIVSASLDWFNLLAQKELTLEPVLMNPVVWLVLIGFVLTLGLLSGGYPAFYLSSFKPIEVIKGKISKGQQGKTLRNGLVVFQFSISICLIICSLFVQKQLSYTSKIDLGLSDENVLQIHNIEQFGFNTEVIKSKLEGIAAVTQVGKSFGVPPNVMTGDRYRSTEPDAQVFQLNNLRVDDDYLNVLDIEFLAGRNFELERPTDQYSVILNQAAVELLGWTTEEAVGKHVAVASGNEDEFEVIGVAKDFNYHTTRQAIGPLILISDKNDKVWDYGAGLSFLSMKLNPQSIQTSSDLKRVLDQAESALNEVDASIPFEYNFMDQAFESNFRTEQRMATVLNFFTLMAMIIACLGLFGLAAFSAEQRTKELSIRKVLGANTGQLTYLFSTGFVKLVVVSILISAPLAYWLVSLWLEGFAYRTPMQLGVFVLASLISLVVAILTTGYQSLYVASRNPVDTLKGE
jgi:putative ABC transport system permease protein